MNATAIYQLEFYVGYITLNGRPQGKHFRHLDDAEAWFAVCIKSGRYAVVGLHNRNDECVKEWDASYK